MAADGGARAGHPAPPVGPRCVGLPARRGGETQEHARGHAQGRCISHHCRSPGQQLARAGGRQGRQGLAGREPILFYAIPAIARAAAELRPDLLAR
eukprot:5649493-Lingulodinium_polyedra.AAC.1